VIRFLITCFLIPFPSFLKVFFFRYFLGWKIGRNVKIGLSLISAKNVEIGDGVYIGHFNQIRLCRYLSVGNKVTIMNNNQITGSSQNSESWTNEIIIEESCYITSHHFFDISGGIIIGNDSVIGGRDTQIWSHSIKMIKGRRELVPKKCIIGRKSYLGARVTLVCNTVPSRSLVGAGAVIAKEFQESQANEGQMIAGNPCKILKKYTILE
jgi:acetyltransferase-like isoleucine patch superfamily enzyme